MYISEKIRQLGNQVEKEIAPYFEKIDEISRFNQEFLMLSLKTASVKTALTHLPATDTVMLEEKLLSKFTPMFSVQKMHL